MMKKLTSLLLALVMCVSLVACGGGGVDKQPAIDAYNQVSENYNAFVDLANAEIESLTDEEIEFFNGCADVLTEYADKLQSDTEFTQEEVDEMVDMFNEFNGIIVETLEEMGK